MTGPDMDLGAALAEMLVFPFWLQAVMLAAFGLCVGSFVNVVAWRMPADLSIVFPGSYCPKCRHSLAAIDNIPVLSFFLLGRKCRYCAQPIGWRYPLVEIATALITLGAFFGFRASFGLAASALLTAWVLALWTVSIIDYDHFFIPCGISCGGAILALAASYFFPEIHSQFEYAPGWLDGFRFRNHFDIVFFDKPQLSALIWSWIGGVSGGLFVWTIGLFGKAIFRKEAMGFGDVELMVLIGAIVGWDGVFATIFIASFLGALIGIFVKVFTRDSYIPFGPFLSCGAAFAMLFRREFYDAFFFIGRFFSSVLLPEMPTGI